MIRTRFIRDMAARAPVWLFCIFSLLALSCQKSSPDVIVIRTTQGTLGGLERTGVRIERKNGKSLAENMLAPERIIVGIPDEQIMAFLEAVQAPSESTLSLSGLGITQNWLDENADPAFDEYFDRRKHGFGLARKVVRRAVRQGALGPIISWSIIPGIRSILSLSRDLFISRFRKRIVNADLDGSVTV
jgi:hypothetical protein